MLCAVKHNLYKQNILITNDKIISELNFGFWTKILTEKHYSNLWRKIFIDVFPNKKIDLIIDKTKSLVAKDFNDLRNFRNRVFHYEPVFNKQPKRYHQKILESTKWMSISLYKISKEFDEFNNIMKKKDMNK